MSSVRAGVSVSGAGRNSEAGGATRLLFDRRRRRRRAKSRMSAVKVAEAPPLPPNKTLSPLPVPQNVPADSEKSSSRARWW